MYCCDHRRSSIRYYVDGTYFAWDGVKRLSSMRGAGAVAEDYRDYSVKCMLMRGQVVRNSYVLLIVGLMSGNLNYTRAGEK
jgi:predicted P-loop ATPase